MALLETTGVAAVLVEYRAEGVDAEAVAYHIKQRFPNQPIVLLSAYVNMPERVLWLVDEAVMRSDPLEQLVEVIDRVTGSTSTFEQLSDKLPGQRRAAG